MGVKRRNFIDLGLIPPGVDVSTTGKYFFVHYTTGVDGTASVGHGLTPERPFKTLDYAIGQCTASQGDIIFLMPGHAETVTTAVTMDVQSTTVCGLGSGDKRPTITVNANIPGINITAADTRFINVRVIAGSSVVGASRLVRNAAANTRFLRCRFEMAYDMYNMIYNHSGDDVKFDECEFENTVSTNADVHPQRALLIKAGRAWVTGCRFMDIEANKAERWRACLAGGALGSEVIAKDNVFICRGIAINTRAAGASSIVANIGNWGISPSSNTAVGSIFTPTYIYSVQTYNVAAVNKVGVVTVTTSDLRMKRMVAYL